MKRIYLKLTILFLIAVIPVAAFNYVLDQYGIFNNLSFNLWYELGHEPNQRYAKIRHLIDDKHSWDSYLFGSSRVGKIDPELLPDGNYYNMNCSEGLPGEHLDDIKVLLANNVPLKNVVIGLDNFSYMKRPDEHRWQIMRHPYDPSIFERVLFQIKYLFSAPRIGFIKNLGFEKSEFRINFNIASNGMHDLEEVDKKIERDIGQHVKGERFRNANNVQFDEADEDAYMSKMEDVIKAIVEITELSKKHNFYLRVFINPTHHKYYIHGNPYHFLRFKEKLAQHIDYWDFSGLNSITTNNKYYYETSHYRTMVGGLIICRMNECAYKEVPEDFGVYITKENVGQHIKEQKDRLSSN